MNRNRTITTVLVCLILGTSLTFAAANVYLTPISASPSGAMRTIDGLIYTYYQADGPPIKYDLGAEYSLVGFSETTWAFPPNEFILSVSTDDLTYLQVDAGYLHYGQNSFTDHLFAPINARFLKLDVLWNANNGSGELGEFRAIIDDSVQSSNVPDSSGTLLLALIAVLGLATFSRTT